MARARDFMARDFMARDFQARDFAVDSGEGSDDCPGMSMSVTRKTFVRAIRRMAGRRGLRTV
jgi:hypothetical protein